MSVKYYPLEKLDGFDITLGQITNGGDCTGGMPAVYLTRRVTHLPKGQIFTQKQKKSMKSTGKDFQNILKSRLT